MARREETITLKDGSQELTFLVKQMPASKADAWAIKAVLLALNGIGGVDHVPAGSDLKAAMAYFQRQGFSHLLSKLSLSYEQAAPLLNELLDYCERIVDSNTRIQVSLQDLDGYVEDFTTISNLRLKVAELTFGFFLPGVFPGLGEIKQAMGGSPQA